MKYRVGDALLQVTECGNGPQALVFLHRVAGGNQDLDHRHIGVVADVRNLHFL